MTMIIKQREFDVSIYPVRALVTTNGVQYEDEVPSEDSYTDLFDIDSDTYFPQVVGKLAWVYVNISFEVKGGSAFPVVSYKLEADNKGLDTWTIMSGVETYTTTTSHVAKRLEGYLKLTAGLVDIVPLSLRLQFKSDAAGGGTELVTAKLKNDTLIRLVGTHRVPE